MNIIIKPNNTIIVQSQNNTKLEQIVQKIMDKQESQWNHGDVLVASATIIGFLGLGSFLIFRIEGSERDRRLQRGFFFLIYLSVFGIISIHLVNIYEIVSGDFHKELYGLLIMNTIFFVGLILFFMSCIAYVQSRGRGKRAKTIDRLGQALARAQEETT